jgi:hypothetical protein
VTVRAIAQAALDEATTLVIDEDYAAAVRTLARALKACVAANEAPEEPGTEHCGDCNAHDEVCDHHASAYVREQRAMADRH